jgi:hypothetical protein
VRHGDRGGGKGAVSDRLINHSEGGGELFVLIIEG